MTLKEKLEVEIMDLPIMDEVVEDIAKNLEYVAEEFAIGFAEWIRVCKLKQRPYDFDNTKELLKTYKQEKEL